jgi:hypothetical protein
VRATRSYLDSSADLSPCGAYRYLLRRTWAEDRASVLWVMVNPSTADGTADDRTIGRCVGFSRAWGFGGIAVVNLFALRSPAVEDLLTHPAPVGPGNDAAIAGQAAAAGLVIAGWGSKGGKLGRLIAARALAVRQVFEAAGRAVHCLRLGGDGHPAHPLMLPSDLRPQPLWPAAGPLHV